MNKKKTIIVLIMLTVAVLLAVVNFYYHRGADVPQQVTEYFDSTIAGEGQGAVSIAGQTAIDKAWQTFSLYLSRLKVHDIAGIKDLSHQQSVTCQDKNLEKECFVIMDSVYNATVGLKREPFVNVLEDGKQMIVYTNPFRDELGTTTLGLLRSYMFFTKTSSGELKVLSLNPGMGNYRPISASSTAEETFKLLGKSIVDSDKDGIIDNEELCVGAYESPQCVKTDPDNRDSNGNGWWDGIEQFFYKK